MDPQFDTALQGIFACSADVAASIAMRAVERRFAVKAIIIKQGDRSNAAYLLVFGKAQALTYSLEGQVLLLHEYMAGDFFGAVGSARVEPEEADVVVIEEVRAAVFKAIDFLVLLERYGCIGVAVSRALMRQLRIATAKVVERSTLSAAGRIHAELLRLARLGDGRSIEPSPVLSQLAVRVNTTRETASRTLNALARRGIVRRERGRLVIVSPRQLEEMIV